MFKYEVTEFVSTYHLIDSVSLLDATITNADRETIRIFFRTYTEPPEENPDTPEEPDTPDNPDGEDTPEDSGENQDTL